MTNSERVKKAIRELRARGVMAAIGPVRGWNGEPGGFVQLQILEGDIAGLEALLEMLPPKTEAPEWAPESEERLSWFERHIALVMLVGFPAVLVAAGVLAWRFAG